MNNIPEFIVKLVLLVGTYFMTLEYVFVCEVETWIGSAILFSAMAIVTILYIIFRAGKISRCSSCKSQIIKS